MIRERESSIAVFSITLQVLLTLGCFILALWGVDAFMEPVGAELKNYKILFLLIIPLWYLLLSQFGLGNLARVKMYSALFVEYLAVIGLGMTFLVVSIVFLDFSEVSWWALVIFAVLDLMAIFTFKLTLYSTMKRFRSRGYNTRSVLIIADDESSFFLDKLIDTKDWGYRIWAVMTDSPGIKARYGHEYLILPHQNNMADLIDGKALDEVMYCKGDMDQKEIRSLIYACAEVGVIFRLQSEFLSVVSMRSHVTYLNQLPFLTFMNTPNNYLFLKVKVFLDYVVASLILVAISPVMLTIALAIKLGDGGPVFFRQKRVGLNGRRFPCLKFRTMVVNAEGLLNDLMSQNEQAGPVFKMRKDPRVTRVGAFLRKTSLDELPQFFNVLRGEMSIVGPRPPVPDEVKEYERWQRRRLSMKPGLTCIWQVSGRNNIPFDQWIKMDMQYIDTWSLKLDLILFLKTIKVVLRGDGR